MLKNAVDWASRPFANGVLRNKTVAVVGASTGRFGAVWAQAELRKVLAASGARVVPNEVAVTQAGQRFDGEKILLNGEQLQALEELILTLTHEIETSSLIIGGDVRRLFFI